MRLGPTSSLNKVLFQKRNFPLNSQKQIVSKNPEKINKCSSTVNPQVPKGKILTVTRPK